MNHYSIYILPRSGHNPYVFLDTNSQLDYAKNMEEIKHYSPQMEEADVLGIKRVFADYRVIITVCIDAIHTIPFAGFSRLSLEETEQQVNSINALLNRAKVKN